MSGLGNARPSLFSPPNPPFSSVLPIPSNVSANSASHTFKLRSHLCKQLPRVHLLDLGVSILVPWSSLRNVDLGSGTHRLWKVGSGHLARADYSCRLPRVLLRRGSLALQLLPCSVRRLVVREGKRDSS